MPRRAAPLLPILLPILPLVLPLVLPLAGCEAMLAPAAAVGGASLVFTGKTPLDHVAGLATRQDCSSVRWERHGPWCVPHPPPPLPMPYCTRSLGAVDCWAEPPRTGARIEVADPGR